MPCDSLPDSFPICCDMEEYILRVLMFNISIVFLFSMFELDLLDSSPTTLVAILICREMLRKIFFQKSTQFRRLLLWVSIAIFP